MDAVGLEAHSTGSIDAVYEDDADDGNGSRIACLERAPEMYRTFRDKEDRCIKVMLRPGD